MVIIQGLILRHALIQVVTVIMGKPHQLLMINLVTTRNQRKQSTKHVHQDLSSLFLINYPYENDISKSNLKLIVVCNQSRTQMQILVNPSIQSHNTHIAIQFYTIRLVNLEKEEPILGQYGVNTLS